MSNGKHTKPGWKAKIATILPLRFMVGWFTWFDFSKAMNKVLPASEGSQKFSPEGHILIWIFLQWTGSFPLVFTFNPQPRRRRTHCSPRNSSDVRISRSMPKSWQTLLHREWDSSHCETSPQVKQLDPLYTHGEKWIFLESNSFDLFFTSILRED